jgi:hypothetical protein
MKYLAIALLLAACQYATAGTNCPSTKTNVRWSAACFMVEGETRRVKPQFRKRVVPEESGFAVISIDETLERLAVDRRGVVVVAGIAWTGDFDYPDAEGGVGRFTVKGKCGYFKASSFKIVVPPIYDVCEAFHDGTAAVCKNCVRYCMDLDCHLSRFVGGEGYILDPRGRVLRRFAPPPLERACGRAGVAEAGQPSKNSASLRCNEDPGDPFKM